MTGAFWCWGCDGWDWVLDGDGLCWFCAEVVND